MKSKLLIMLGLLLIIGLGCEPQGGGAGYQYLGKADSIHLHCDIDGNYTTTVRVNNDSFTVVGKIALLLNRRSLDIFVWINTAEKSLRLRRYSMTVEHKILIWKTLDWRKNECK